MKEAFAALRNILKKDVSKMSHKVWRVLGFIKVHYTPLSIIVLFLCGTVLFFIIEYMFQYNHWDYWHWKKRAVRKAVFWLLFLILAKLIFIGVSR